MPLVLFSTDFQLPSFTEYLKYGPFGVAVVMLILGFYLHWRAMKEPTNAIAQAQLVGRQFLRYAMAFFVVASVFEIIKLFFPQHTTNEVYANILVPPLRDSTHEKYGDVKVDAPGESFSGSNKPHLIKVTDKDNVTVDLNDFVDRFDAIRQKYDAAQEKRSPELQNCQGK